MNILLHVCECVCFAWICVYTCMCVGGWVHLFVGNVFVEVCVCVYNRMGVFVDTRVYEARPLARNLIRTQNQAFNIVKSAINTT